MCNVALASKLTCEHAVGFHTSASARACYCTSTRATVTDIQSFSHPVHALSLHLSLSLSVCLYACGNCCCCLATRCCQTLCAYLAASVWLEQENESVKSEPALSRCVEHVERARRCQRRIGIGRMWSPLRHAAICDWASWPVCPSGLPFDIAVVSAMLSFSGKLGLATFEVGWMGAQWARSSNLRI